MFPLFMDNNPVDPLANSPVYARTNPGPTDSLRGHIDEPQEPPPPSSVSRSAGRRCLVARGPLRPRRMGADLGRAGCVLASRGGGVCGGRGRRRLA